MSSIKKVEPLPHIVLVDTNILWCKDKTPPVNPEFDSFWAAHEKIIELELIIPEVVRGEILFQQTTSALKSLERAKENMNHVSAITADQHIISLEAETVRMQIAGKFDQWAKSKNALVAGIPLATIDWNRLCNDAIWHLPPFESDSKNSEYEKGFRDALTLESIKDFVKKEKRAVNIVFICNDMLLRTTALEELGNDSRCSCYASLSDFSSYIKLTKEELTKEFISSILGHASENFYSVNNPNCFYNKYDISTKVVTDFKSLFDDPNNSDPSMKLLAYPSFLSKPRWGPITNGEWFLDNPQFRELSGSDEYHWTSVLTFIKCYRELQSVSYTVLIPPQEKILILPFLIDWKGRVTADGMFHDFELENIEIKNNIFRSLTEEEKLRYIVKKN